MRKLDGTLLPQSSDCDAVREDKTLLQFAEAKRRTFHSFEFLPSRWSCLASRVGSCRYNLSPTKELNPPTDVRGGFLFSHEQASCPRRASVFDFFVRQSANEVGIREIGGSERTRKGNAPLFQASVSTLRLRPLSEPFSGCSIEATKEND